MKIRNGFVSNSSSSSFLIVFDKQYTASVYQDFGGKKHNYSDETYINAIGHNDVIEEFKDWYGLNGDDAWGGGGPDDVARFYKRASQVAQHVEAGREVAIVNISYHDNDANDAIDNYEIIESFN